MPKGFTLIELLIVIAILGILSTMGIGNFMSSRIKAVDLNRKSDLAAIAKSLEAYANDHRGYPVSDSSDKIICHANGDVCNWGTPFVDDSGSTVYITKLPLNPSGNNYVYQSDGKKFSLYTHLDNTQDPAIITIDPSINVKCGTTTLCNYKVTSSNQ